ncbi:MAG: T9SS type A sorting domain-containing protein [Dysgonamonadaceae bacterium]|jgi:hypothetical protein|nr:T9SS type A sorting domain-containing protein [Dysgonamonadaceae bacterium]
MKKIVFFMTFALSVTFISFAQNMINQETTAIYRLLSEDFQGWDGDEWDWIPDGWTDESKVDSPSDYLYGEYGTRANSTWAVRELPVPYSGDMSVGVIFDYNEKEQDEWLITPEVELKQDSYTLNFYLYYNPAFMRKDVTPVFDKLNNLVEVYISDDGGTTWTKKWSNEADAARYTYDELMEIVMGLREIEWLSVSIDLGEYLNKNIKIAFRYWNNGFGESAFINYVEVVGSNTGFKAINPNNDVKAYAKGDNFVVSYPAGTTSAAVYNVAGQKIAEYTLNPAGSCSIPAANLPKGVYVIKFAGKGAESVKVIK